MKWLALPPRDWRLILGGAFLTVLAYPPFHLFLPSFLAVVPAVWLIADTGEAPGIGRRMLARGFWYGLLGHGLVLYWMVGALWHFTPLSALGYAATIAILAAYTAVVFWTTHWVRMRTALPIVLVLPVLWTAAEWLIGHQGDIRFPWLGLGTSLTGFPTVVQIADVVGARGVTFLLVLANAALAEAWLLRGSRAAAARRAGFVVVGVVVATTYGVIRERTLVLRDAGTIAVIQPNVGYDEKWVPGVQDSLMAELIALSQRAVDATAPDLVVWPEAAVPGTFYQRPSWLRSIQRHAAANAVPTVVGAIDREVQNREDVDYFNAAFVIDGVAPPTPGVYRKRYLVPITERVPFVNPDWFGGLEFFGAFVPGNDGPTFDSPVGRFGILICYESIFENLARQYRRDGADVLLNITNDAWFGRTSAPYQHPAHLVMRAIETRAGIARAANSGISMFVDPLGRVAEATPIYQQDFRAAVLRTTDVRTVYVALGDWVGVTSVVVALFLVAYARWKR